jgi:exodeoxyribonuclease VII small subunit
MSKKTVKENNNNQKAARFEDNLRKLEEIIVILEKGEIDLEESIKCFREGSSLYRLLRSELEKAEGEVKVIIESLEGNPVLEEFVEE